MSIYLWKYYLEDDIDSFRTLLAAARYSGPAQSKGHGTGGNVGLVGASPGKAQTTSPSLRSKSISRSEWGHATRGNKGLGHLTLTRADINSRDAHGVSLLHLMASSTADNASSYALAYLELPMLDLYIQDLESGWTSLHRALYFGNVTIARALMDRDNKDATALTSTPGTHNAGELIKIKDREGNSPFDVFGATVRNRILRHGSGQATIDSSNETEEEDEAHGDRVIDEDGSHACMHGDELYTFGSNKNFTLGFGDEDDRQFPERITLKRPEHLLRLLCVEHQQQSQQASQGARSPQNEEAEFFSPDSVPALVRYRSIKILDVQLSKFHTAVLTTDPEANLYVCGFGPGGRLGTGDETTRFNFTCIGLFNKQIVSIGLGQNHTIAVSSEGEVYSWGSNAFGQLGYVLPTTNPKDNEPVQLQPRKIFGPLKREIVLGGAASRTHSVVYTATSLYTFGKNDGQLGLVDSDARSLETQTAPRKVAASLFSSPIRMVSAIDKATICLLENHDVWVFANYGWKKMMFPLDGPNNFFQGNYFSVRHDSSPNHITKISSGGDTICALAKTGDVFTVAVSQNVESCPAPTSTTNPAKIRGALSTPQRIWSLRKSHMAVRDVDVGQDGSVVICTESGSVWKRVKRAKIKDASSASRSVEYRSKDYKFSRIPGLTRVIAVRSNAFGAFAAVRKDADVLRMQVEVDSSTLWKNLFPLLPFHNLSKEEDSDCEQPVPRFWRPQRLSDDAATIRHAVLTTKNLENDIEEVLAGNRSLGSAYDLMIGTTGPGARIPCHEFMVTGRSSFLRSALQRFRQSYYYVLPDVLTIEYNEQGNTLILFQGIDFITILNLVFYIYTDSVIDVWHHTRHARSMAIRYRQVRTELMKVAAQLDMRGLEHAVRLMVAPSRALHQDMQTAILDAQFFETGDAVIELSDAHRKVHSALMCQRCPFFDGLFHGRAAGSWLSSRRKDLQEPQEAIKVDFKHVKSEVFDLVLRHVYSDVGEELFDGVVTSDFDTFLDLIMDVLSVANELMVDRLAQVCQKVLGQFVNTRNVCQLLNAVAPCSVTGFKDAALEYICLNLEGMLENHLLNELDDDLMLELDEVVRQNQLACLPFAKSGRAEALLHEQHPELAALLDRDRRAKIDSMAIQSPMHEDEVKLTTGAKGKENIAEDVRQSTNNQLSRPEISKGLRLTMANPSLKSYASANDLMFEMDEDDELEERGKLLGKNRMHNSDVVEGDDFDNHESRTLASSLPREAVWFDSRGTACSPPNTDLDPSSLADVGGPSPAGSQIQYPSAHTNTANVTQLSDTKTPWKMVSFTSTKLDLKEIMTQTDSKSPSQIYTGSLDRVSNADSVRASSGAKISQKERKKQLQQQQLRQGIISSSPEVASSGSTIVPEKPASPWRTASVGTRISLKDVLNGNKDNDAESPNHPSGRTSSQPQLTLRQTVPGNTVMSRKQSKERNSPLQSTQLRSVSSPNITISTFSSPAVTPSRPLPQPHQTHSIASSSASPSMPTRSTRHTPLPIEPSLQLSMADILSQQQTEKDIIKEAVARRSLQEIQEEQAFQEWWDQEEAATKARLLEEEAATKAPSASRSRGERAARGGRGRGRGGGGRGVGRAERGGHGSAGPLRPAAGAGK